MAPGRPIVFALTVVMLAGCANAPNASPDPSASGPAAESPGGTFPNGVVQPETRAYADARVTDGAEAELESIAAGRSGAGFEALLGEHGAAFFANEDAAETQAGEKLIPDAARELGIDLTATALIAALKGAPGDEPPPPSEWTGSVTGHATFTIAMLTGLLAGGIKLAGQTGQGSTTSSETFNSSEGGVNETAKLTTSWTLKVGEGHMTGDVQLGTNTTGTDATSGSAVGALVGKAKGKININACPDANGVVKGSLELTREEALTPTGGTGAGFAQSFIGEFEIFVGDDASLQRIESTFNMSKGAHGPGSPGGDPSEPFNWGVGIQIPATIDAGGGISFDKSKMRDDGNATTVAQVQETFNLYLSAYPVLVEIGKQAEAFWRSGQCVDLLVYPDTQEVEPEEEISVEVNPEGKFDHAAIDAPVYATFSGKDTLEPTGSPVDPPAKFDFKAGKEEGDVGTISYTQTSRRGIGKKTVTYTVKGKDLLLNVSGTLNDSSLGASLTFTADQVTLKSKDGYKATASFRVGGSVFIPGVGCSKAVSLAGPAEVTASPDEADPNQVRLRITPGSWAAAPIVQVTCEDTTVPVPVASLLWFLNFSIAGPPLVKIDATTTVSAGSPAAGTATVTLTRPKQQ